MNRIYAMVAALFAALYSSVAFAQTTPLEDMTTDAQSTITAVGVLAAALAVAMIAIKAIPVAYKWVTAFLNR